MSARGSFFFFFFSIFVFFCRLTDAGLDVIGERLGGNLIELALHRSEGITNEGISRLAGSCPNLALLSLSACSQISDEGICQVSVYEKTGENRRKEGRQEGNEKDGRLQRETERKKEMRVATMKRLRFFSPLELLLHRGGAVYVLECPGVCIYQQTLTRA